MYKLPSALNLSHQLLTEVIKPNSQVIDGTTGNGHDTLFMASLLNDQGKVFGFDIQPQAIENTEKLLINNNLNDRVLLFNDSHATITNKVPVNIDAAIFNLGYLPGGDKDLITKPDSTLTAIKSCLDKLNPGGLVIVVIYYGHNGGQKEKDALLEFSGHLEQKLFSVATYQFINQINEPPILLAIQKR